MRKFFLLRLASVHVRLAQVDRNYRKYILSKNIHLSPGYHQLTGPRPQFACTGPENPQTHDLCSADTAGPAEWSSSASTCAAALVFDFGSGQVPQARDPEDHQEPDSCSVMFYSVKHWVRINYWIQFVDCIPFSIAVPWYTCQAGEWCWVSLVPPAGTESLEPRGLFCPRCVWRPPTRSWGGGTMYFHA